jgi:hypothetical protein
MLSRIAQCSNQIFSEEEENTFKLHQELIMDFLDVISCIVAHDCMAANSNRTL